MMAEDISNPTHPSSEGVAGKKKLSYLVLAVPVATGGTTSHFDGVLTLSVLALVVGDFKSGPTRGVKGPPCRYPSDRGRWQ